MASATEAVTRTRNEGITTVRLAREHGNAINASLVDGLAQAYREAAADPDVRGVLLAAAGKIFCPGLDLRELLKLDRSEMEGFMRRFEACVLAMYAFEKPVVAAVSGHALAGGCVLALTADWRILKRGSIVGLNEVRVGLPLPFGVALVLREAVPVGRLEEVALVGRNYSDEEAASAGLVHELHDEAGFEDHCRARLLEYASKEPGALATTKRYLRSGTVERIRGAGDRFLGEFLDCWFSSGTRSRIEEIVAGLEGRGR